MSTKHILVVGGGFAGLWSAIGAARKLDELGLGPDSLAVTLVNRDAYHGIRVRSYESDLSSIRVPLDDVLGPVGVRRVAGEVVEIDLADQNVYVQTAHGRETLHYDRLVFAPGSQLARPPIPGLSEFGFDVDTYQGAARLEQHLRSLASQPESAGKYTALVVGAGLTGIETATELPGRLQAILAHAGLKRNSRVMLADHKPHVGSDMGDAARPVIETALAGLGVETRMGIDVVAIDQAGVTLKSGETIPAATVVWCAGMRASPLTCQFPVERDRFGRIAVDEFLRVKGVADVFAAGDAAWMLMDDCHPSVMSCQHSRPMGRFAGHNVVCDLLNLPMLPLRIDWYVTVLDLGPWGAVYTHGWDRHVFAKGESAKRTKQIINCQRIYPPLNGNRRDILAAAAPEVQRPPDVHP